MAPHPSGISTNVTKTPQPLWKSSFSRRKTIKVEDWGHLWLVRNSFHQNLGCFCFHLFEWSCNIKGSLKHTTPPQSNLISNFAYLLLKMKRIKYCEFTLIKASLRFVIHLHGCNVDIINSISCGNTEQIKLATTNLMQNQEKNKNSEFWNDHR